MLSFSIVLGYFPRLTGIENAEKSPRAPDIKITIGVQIATGPRLLENILPNKGGLTPLSDQLLAKDLRQHYLVGLTSIYHDANGGTLSIIRIRISIKLGGAAGKQHGREHHASNGVGRAGTAAHGDTILLQIGGDRASR